MTVRNLTCSSRWNLMIAQITGFSLLEGFLYWMQTGDKPSSSRNLAMWLKLSDCHENAPEATWKILKSFGDHKALTQHSSLFSRLHIYCFQNFLSCSKNASPQGDAGTLMSWKPRSKPRGWKRTFLFSTDLNIKLVSDSRFLCVHEPCSQFAKNSHPAHTENHQQTAQSRSDLQRSCQQRTRWSI